jgi:hypothetical protein
VNHIQDAEKQAEAKRDQCVDAAKHQPVEQMLHKQSVHQDPPSSCGADGPAYERLLFQRKAKA